MTTDISRRNILAASALAPVAGILAANTAQAAASSLRYGSHGDAVATLQRNLNASGYWCGAVDGSYGMLTVQAVTTIQKIYGWTRNGIADSLVQSAAAKHLPVRPYSTVPGIEIHLGTQTLWTIGHGQSYMLDTSTADTNETFMFYGRLIRANTPTGTFHVYEKVNGWQNGALGYMYKPCYFEGSVAIHGVPDNELSAYPASHGCSRISVAAQDMLLSTHRLGVGTQVRVYR